MNPYPKGTILVKASLYFDVPDKYYIVLDEHSLPDKDTRLELMLFYQENRPDSPYSSFYDVITNRKDLLRLLYNENESLPPRFQDATFVSDTFTFAIEFCKYLTLEDHTPMVNHNAAPDYIIRGLKSLQKNLYTPFVSVDSPSLPL